MLDVALRHGSHRGAPGRRATLEPRIGGGRSARMTPPRIGDAAELDMATGRAASEIRRRG